MVTALVPFRTPGSPTPEVPSINMASRNRLMGYGSPEGIFPARIAQEYVDLDTGEIWVKKTGDKLKTGWVPDEDSSSTVIATGSTTARTNANRAGDVVNVKDYGALGEGISSSDVDQAAFDYLIDLGVPLTIFVPRGTYFVTLTLNAKTKLRGDGREVTIFRPRITTQAVLTLVGEINVDHELGYIGHFSIDCLDSDDDVVTGLDGLHLGGNFNADDEDLSRTTIEQIYIHNAGLDGIHLESATSCMFANIYVQDCGRYGIFVDNESNVQMDEFRSCQFRQNHTGAYFGSGNNLKFLNCNFESNRNCGFYISRRYSSGLAHANFDACWWEGNGHTPTTVTTGSGASAIPEWPFAGRAQVYLDGAGSAVILDSDGESLSQLTLPSGIIFTNCNFQGIQGDPAADNAFSYDIAADRAQNVLFDRCKFTKVARGGFTSEKFRYTNSAGCVSVLLRQCGSLNQLPTPTMYASFPTLTVLAGESTQASYGIFYEFWWKGRLYTNRLPFGHAGTPIGALVPAYQGEIIQDTSNAIFYAATGLTNADWLPLSGVLSGEYTPTLDNASNISASTAYPFQYTRVGNVVSVFGRVEIDATAAATTLLHLTIPITSNLGGDGDAVGHATSWRTGSAGIESAVVFADGSIDKVKLLFAAVDVEARDWFVTFAYKVVAP